MAFPLADRLQSRFMRLWTLHPKYLDARGLVALWREALPARAVLRGERLQASSATGAFQVARNAAVRDQCLSLGRPCGGCGKALLVRPAQDRSRSRRRPNRDDDRTSRIRVAENVESSRARRIGRRPLRSGLRGRFASRRRPKLATRRNRHSSPDHRPRSVLMPPRRRLPSDASRVRPVSGAAPCSAGGRGGCVYAR